MNSQGLEHADLDGAKAAATVKNQSRLLVRSRDETLPLK